MFYRVKNTVKKIIIKEIQDLIKDHPQFHDTLVINKYQDQEREKINVIVKSASASSQRISLDNFCAMAHSYTTLANLKGQRGDMLEWVSDDINNIQNLVPPGFYVIRMDTINTFVVEQYLTIRKEPLELTEVDQQGHSLSYLKHQKVNIGSEVITDDRGQLFVRNQHYTINYDTGLITFLMNTEYIQGITATYQYLEPQIGPFPMKSFEMNNTALPGVVLAFGDQVREGDLQVVVVSDKREISAMVKSGSWNMNLDIEIRAQDTDTSEQLVDFIANHIWAYKQEELVDIGLTITDISVAGESEEQEVDVPDEWSFVDTLSLTIIVQWEVHLPIIGRIEKIYIKPPMDTGIYDGYVLNQYEKLYQENNHYDSFGTVDDNKAGRYDDFDNGDRHFHGLVPIESLKTVVRYPTIFF
jgi:hypothetical protein